jgi:hypothetical protein
VVTGGLPAQMPLQAHPAPVKIKLVGGTGRPVPAVADLRLRRGCPGDLQLQPR